MILASRRKFIGGLASLIVAPAIVRIENIMPIMRPKKLIIPEGIYEVYMHRIVMVRGEIITDMQLAEDTSKYIRSIMRVT